MIDEAIAAKENGNDIIYITCGSCLDSCYSNPLKSKVFCKICVKDYKNILSSYLGENLRHKTLNEYSTNEVEDILNEYVYEFNSIEELKVKEFRGIDVGYSTLSSFISNTRNLCPEISLFSKEVLIRMLRSAVRVAAMCEQIYEQEKPEKILLYNGRMPESRPVLRYFLSKGIDVDVHEVYPTNLTGNFKKIIYHNALPHSVSYFKKRISEEWEKNKIKGEELGKLFFEKRRNAAFSGDKVYVKGQQVGLLPSNWKTSSRNIVIFNSSEDEFVAIGEEWENSLFPSQLKGIEYLFNCIDKYQDAEIYLRIHPNLKNIKYKYHHDLYKLRQHPRIHVIPSESKISTYALVDAADVIVSFGTSVGVEAAYASKAVVLIGPAFYKGLGFCYEPTNVAEMESQIFLEALVARDNENILKYGNYIMCDKGRDYSYYNFNCFQLSIGGIRTPNVAMIDQSKKNMGIIKSFLMRVWRDMQRKYLKLRIKEA